MAPFFLACSCKKALRAHPLLVSFSLYIYIVFSISEYLYIYIYATACMSMNDEKVYIDGHTNQIINTNILFASWSIQINLKSFSLLFYASHLLVLILFKSVAVSKIFIINAQIGAGELSFFCEWVSDLYTDPGIDNWWLKTN